MQLQKDKSAIRKDAESLQPSDGNLFYEGSEWLETNGLGGWAGSTIIGCNTRRYHGLLVAATKPPTERMVLLSKLDETIVVSNERFELSTNLYNNDVIQPKGYQYLTSFIKELFPEWLYECNGIQLKKTITMIHGENTTIIIYEVLKANEVFTLELLPLIAARGYHSLQHSYNNIFWDVQFENGIFKNQRYDGAPNIFISVPNSTYKHHPSWFYKFNYAVEKYRGLDFEEDLFNHGTIAVEVKEGDKLGIIISAENPSNRNAEDLFEKERERKLKLINQLTNKPINQSTYQPLNLSTTQLLTLAADQFIVKRDEDLKTIIAGYHWFTDWGRDTMISLPGLCLSTVRYEDAKKNYLRIFKKCKHGYVAQPFSG